MHNPGKSQSDSGTGSLRHSIEVANNRPGPNRLVTTMAPDAGL